MLGAVWVVGVVWAVRARRVRARIGSVSLNAGSGVVGGGGGGVWAVRGGSGHAVAALKDSQKGLECWERCGW